MVQYLQKGLLGHIGHAIGAVFKWSLIGLIVGIVLTEIGGAIFDNQIGAAAAVAAAGWPHNIFFHIAAIAMGIILAIALALFTAFRETLRGLLDVARGVEGDVGKLAGVGRDDITGIVDSIEHRN